MARRGRRRAVRGLDAVPRLHEHAVHGLACEVASSLNETIVFPWPKEKEKKPKKGKIREGRRQDALFALPFGHIQL